MNAQPTTERGERPEVRRLRAEHDNIAQLLLVLESHLALMNDGEPFDSTVVLEALDYLIDYVQDFHRSHEAEVLATISARHDAIQTSGAELYHRLDLATRDDTMNRTEVAQLGYAYCAELRRLICVEERALCEGDREGDAAQPGAPPGEAEYRSRFEALTRRVGCNCRYEQR